MTYPSITATYAAVLGVEFAILSIWVIAGRLSTDTLHGDGGQDGLQKRIRAHGNFAEYVPIALLLVGLLEGGGAGRGSIHGLLLVLLLGRVLHPFGMFAAPNSPRQFACRGGGILATVGVIVTAAIMLLIRAG